MSICTYPIVPVEQRQLMRVYANEQVRIGIGGPHAQSRGVHKGSAPNLGC